MGSGRRLSGSGARFNGSGARLRGSGRRFRGSGCGSANRALSSITIHYHERSLKGHQP